MSGPRIKVLQIIKSLGRGGAETLLVETLKLHDKNKFEFHYIYFLPWKDQLVGELRAHGGMVTCISASNNLHLLSRVWAIARYVRANNIQIIHAHLPWAGIAARFVGRMTRVPVLYTEHNKQERYHFATRKLNLATMGWLSRLIPVSVDVEESVRKYKRGIDAIVQTIPNGVNVDHFRPDEGHRHKVRNQLGIPIDAPVIMTIAVFRVQKRLDIWMEVAAKIIKSRPDAHFIIVGDGPLKEQLYQKRKELSLESVVHMVGLQTDVRPYLGSADIFMISSVFEGLPIALLEAMSAALPVVSTSAGGIKEVVRHEIEGLLCDVDTPFNLAEHALWLMNNPHEATTLGKASRNRVQNTFSMNRMVASLETLYHTFVSQPK